jgi:hypothetical protein
LLLVFPFPVLRPHHQITFRPRRIAGHKIYQRLFGKCQLWFLSISGSRYLIALWGTQTARQAVCCFQKF